MRSFGAEICFVPENPEDKITAMLAEGDVRAVELLYDHYADALYGVVFRMLKDEAKAQDVLQECFVKIWKNTSSYDRSKGRLFTWLINIVRNRAVDELRKQKRSGEIRGEATDVSLKTVAADGKAEGTEHDMNKVLQELDKHSRELVEHSYILGYTHPEIAEKFDIPLGTVKTRIRNAMKELRSIFSNGHA